MKASLSGSWLLARASPANGCHQWREFHGSTVTDRQARWGEYGFQIPDVTLISWPRADHGPRIAALQAEQLRLVQSLQGTMLNLKTFVPLVVKYNHALEFPSASSRRYLPGRRPRRLAD